MGVKGSQGDHIPKLSPAPPVGRYQLQAWQRPLGTPSMGTGSTEGLWDTLGLPPLAGPRLQPLLQPGVSWAAPRLFRLLGETRHTGDHPRALTAGAATQLTKLRGTTGDAAQGQRSEGRAPP